MAKAKKRSESAATSRARERASERERRVAQFRESEARARHRRIKLIGLCILCVAFGGVSGAYLARSGLLGGPLQPTIAIALSEEVEKVATATIGTRSALAKLPEVQDTAGQTAEASEAALVRLYEEPLEEGTEEVESLVGSLDVRVSRRNDVAALSFPNPVISTPLFWQNFAVPIQDPGDRPMIAVVIDDLGLNRPGAHRAISLPAPLTLAFMTYAEGLDDMAAKARAAGHELMLHMPMQPRSESYDPGPNVLVDGLSPEELQRRLNWGLERFEGFVGVNNHMGSKFTASTKGMAVVIRALKARGLLFLDSVTSGASVGAAVAERAGVPYARRDIFIDNVWNDRAEIARQLDRLEAVARRQGYAVGIGHPHRATLDVLARWLPEARARGFEIVPISAIVRHRFGLAQDIVQPAG